MSTFANFSITTIEGFKTWILQMMGADLIQVEITDSQLDLCISNAIEVFTKYAVQDEDYFAYNLSGYVENVGITLPNDVVGIHTFNSDMMTYGGIDRLFSIPNQMWNAGIFPIPSSQGALGMGTGGGWVNYELALQYMDLVKRMMGGGYQFDFNVRTKVMKLWPDPKKEGDVGWIVVGVYRIRPETYLYGEDWIKRYALAEAKIIVGTVRSKYQGVQLLGGGTLNTEIRSEGIAERDKLLEDLQINEQGPYKFFVG